jgi:hypothetical protein
VYVNSDEFRIHLAFVVCGKAEIAHNALVPINSAILLSQSRLVLHLVVDREPKKEFKKIVNQQPRRLGSFYLNDDEVLRTLFLLFKFSKWPKRVRERVSVLYYKPYIPEKNKDWWRSTYKPCSSIKIFLPVSWK